MTLNADGSFTYTPDPNYSGPDSFTYRSCDDEIPQLCSTPATVNLTVNPVNDTPQANNDGSAGLPAATVNEDDANGVNINVMVNDTGLDEGPITVTATDGAKGTVTVNPDGTVTYKPSANQNGDDTFTYTVRDADGDSDTATVFVRINPVNDDPVANDDAANAQEDGNPVEIDVLANDTDGPDTGEALSVQGVTQPPSGEGTVAIVQGQNGNPDTVRFTPSANFFGQTSFTYTVSDGNGGTDTATVNVSVEARNDAPPTLSINDVTVVEGSGAPGNTVATFTLTRTGNLRNASTVEFATANGTATEPGDYASKTGTVTFAPDQETAEATVTVEDDALDEANETFSVNLTKPSNATIAAGDAGQGTGTIEDNDPEPTLSVSDADPNPVVEGNAGDTKTITFTVTLSGPSGREVRASYATDNGSATTGSDYVAASGTLIFAPGETSKTVAVTVNGDTRDENDEGFSIVLTDPVNASASDARGAATIADDDTQADLGVTKSGPPTATNGQTFGYTITVTNNGPGAAEGVVVTDDLPAGVDFNVAESTDGCVLDEATPDPNDVRCTLANLSFDDSATFTIDVTPNGTGRISNTASATSDTDDPTPDNNTSGAVDTTVNPASVNDAPVVDLNGAGDGVDQTTPVDFTEGAGPVGVDAGDDLIVSDVDDENIESATVTITNLQDGGAELLSATGTANISVGYANGVLTLTGAATKAEYEQVLKSVTYENTSQDPTAGNRGIELVVNDGGLDSAPATAIVAVTPVNDAPVVTFTNPDGDTQTVDEGPQTRLYRYTVDNTDGPDATITESCGEGGTKVADEPGDPTNSFRCVFADGRANPAVRVTANDGWGANNTGSDSVAVEVKNVEPAVTAPGNQGANEGASTSFDLGSFTDPGADGPWTATVDWGDGSQVENLGAFASPGSLGSRNHTYADDDSDKNAPGNQPYIVTVTVEEADGTPRPSGEATFEVTVNNVAPVNSGPTATDGAARMDEDAAPITIDFAPLVSDTETADENLTYDATIAAADVAKGTLTGTGSTRTFTPANDFNGTVEILYTVTDRGDPDGCTPGPDCAAPKTSDQKGVTVTVVPVNDPPAPKNDGVTTRGGGPVTVDVLANDADPDGKNTLDPSSVKIAGGQGPSNGTVSVDPATGRITYTPNAGFVGDDSFAYEVCDDATTPMCKTATVTVRSEAAAPRADLELRANTPKQVRVGQKFAYGITVTNHGPDAARNAVMTSVLPQGVKFVSAKGCAYNATRRTVTCALGNMADGATKAMKITVQATKPGNLSLGGCAVKSDTADPQRADNRRAANDTTTSATSP